MERMFGPLTDEVDVHFWRLPCMGHRVHSLVRCHVVLLWFCFSLPLLHCYDESDCIYSAFEDDTYFCTGDQD